MRAGTAAVREEEGLRRLRDGAGTLCLWSARVVIKQGNR